MARRGRRHMKTGRMEEAGRGGREGKRDGERQREKREKRKPLGNSLC